MPNARRIGSYVCVVVSVLLAAHLVRPGSATHAQQPTAPPQAPPVFRGGTTFVSVDAYPRRDGELIEGLTADDFQVFEDGEPQNVETFQFIRIDSNPLDSERRDPNTKADSDRQAADPRNRIFVVYLDLTHTTISGSHYARQPIVDFLTRTIGTTDLFGVLTAEVPVSQLVFGRRTETLEGELTRYWPWGQADRSAGQFRTPKERWLAECGADSLIPLWREDQMMTSLEHLMLRLGGLRDERKNVIFLSEGWVPKGPATELANATVSRGAVPRIGTGPGGRIGIGQTMQPFGQDPASCDTEIARLASIDFEMRFRQLLTLASQANVSFYPVDVGGLKTTRSRATDTLQTLAESTDGFAVVNSNDLAAGVRRITNDLSAFYLLGYYSTNQAANGRFREIEVKVNQPRVRVSARRGYLAPTEEMLAAASAPRDNSGPSAVDDALGRLAAARDDTEMFAVGTPALDGIHVAVELSASTARRDAWLDGASVRAVATGSNGASASASAEIAGGTRTTNLTIPLPSSGGADTWQVVVQVAGDGQRLEQRVEVVSDPPRLIGMPIGFRGAPSRRAPLTPLADPRLSRRERLRVEWPVIAPAGSHVARLLDRTGSPLGEPLPSTQANSGNHPVIAVDLPLSSLPEGDFLIELVASNAGVSERQLLAFRVVR